MWQVSHDTMCRLLGIMCRDNQAVIFMGATRWLDMLLGGNEWGLGGVVFAISQNSGLLGGTERDRPADMIG